MGDALGSVRQMSNQAGAISLAQNYDPYGSVIASAGAVQTSYGFDGEATDSATGLVYLRSRFYAPDMGRFMSRDTWGGNTNQPMAFNLWNYTDANPINRGDPSGQCWATVPGSGDVPVWIPDGVTSYCPDRGGLDLGRMGTLPWGPTPADGGSYVGYGGAQLWDVYNGMSGCTRAWWLKSKPFDPYTLIGLMILQEASFSFKPEAKDPLNDTTPDANADTRANILVTVAATNLYDGRGQGDIHYKSWKCNPQTDGPVFVRSDELLGALFRGCSQLNQ